MINTSQHHKTPTRIMASILLIAAVLLLVNIPIQAAADISIDTSAAMEGAVTINYNKLFAGRVKVIVSKDDTPYTYTLI